VYKGGKGEDTCLHAHGNRNVGVNGGGGRRHGCLAALVQVQRSSASATRQLGTAGNTVGSRGCRGDSLGRHGTAHPHHSLRGGYCICRGQSERV
jgi:hypothetical protein